MKIVLQSRKELAQEKGPGIVVQDYGMLREAGFEGIDWNLDVLWDIGQVRQGTLEKCVLEQPLEEIMQYFVAELAAIRENGLSVCQTHAPFPSYVEGHPEINKRIITILKQCIQLCQKIGCPFLVVHGISQPTEPGRMSGEELYRLNMELYSALIPALLETDVVVLLENLITSTPNGAIPAVCCDAEEAVGYIDALNEKAGKECFGLCFDVGHFNICSKDFKSYLGKLGKRVKALHIHDNDGRGDSHYMPYSGSVCWKDFCQALKEIGYKGNLSFESFNYYTSWRMEPSLVPVFMKATAEVGKEFRRVIQGGKED